MRSKVYLISAAAALGGLLFGFDIAVINGALVFLRKQFQLSDLQTEVAASSLLLGCVFGASLAGTLSDRFGRKRILLWAASLFLVSSIGAALPRNLSEFTAARLLGGVAIGMESMLSPLYVAEISPARIRGRLVALNQLAIVVGILCAYLISWLLAGLGDASWRWMFASAVLPSLLFLISFVRCPETPRWLIQKGEIAEARSVLTRVGTDGDIDVQIREIQEAIASEQGSLAELFQPSLRRPLIIAVALAVLQQVTGINTILFYGSLIFTEKVASQTAASALWANVMIGFVNLASTVVALAIIDRIGRKPLLMLAAGGMAITEFLLGLLFWLDPGAAIPILCLVLACVAFFAVGLGPGVWVMMSELFPTRIRGRAMSIATISLWIACLALTFTFLSLARAITVTGAFWTYATMCVLTFLFVWKLTPETKGKTLEEIERGWASPSVTVPTTPV
ncbi:MAG: sugar porter family MFS transporter [Acidobacteriia bacterium]|nr:sugar porter family MFS transporter [Terriglobia bacterium]